MNPIFINVACVLIGCFVMYAYLRGKDEDRIQRLAKLGLRPEKAIGHLLAPSIVTYVWHLHCECISVRRTLLRLPLHAAGEATEEINKYWAQAIERLAQINPEAVDMALRKHSLTREHPCQVLPDPKPVA